MSKNTTVAFNTDISFRGPLNNYTKMFHVKPYDKVKNSELYVKIMLGSPVVLGCSVSSGPHS